MSGDGWRPIETAPTDGTRVLVWCLNSKQCEIAFHVGAAFWDWLADDGARVVATHWQPLPAPPKDDGDG